ncbi:MAG: hypothetical protein LBS87_03305 [Puniceicoccales bacterium]|nr:hypothetical protein [Puniceicoccales bacterium]
MNSCIALRITKRQETEILQKASQFDGTPIEICDESGKSMLNLVGRKEFGVEGGAIITLKNRQVGMRNGENSQQTSSFEGASIVPGDESGKPSLGVTDKEKPGAESEMATTLNSRQTEMTEEPEVRYMAKVMFEDKDKRGEYYYRPQAKSAIRAWYSRENLKSVNTNVMQEFMALRLARIINPDIVPDAKLGQVTEENSQTRLFLMTELAGQRKDETFKNFSDVMHSETVTMSKEMWKASFAISVGLLNDQDVNKEDNIGVISKGEENKLCLFDLGHPTPDKFELDKNTLLPKSTTILADVLLWVINLFVSARNLPATFTMIPEIKGQLTVEERAEALQMVLQKKGEILSELDKMANEFSDNLEMQKAIQNMKAQIERRMIYLDNILEQRPLHV